MAGGKVIGGGSYNYLFKSQQKRGRRGKQQQLQENGWYEENSQDSVLIKSISMVASKCSNYKILFSCYFIFNSLFDYFYLLFFALKLLLTPFYFQFHQILSLKLLFYTLFFINYYFFRTFAYFWCVLLNFIKTSRRRSKENYFIFWGERGGKHFIFYSRTAFCTPPKWSNISH